MIRRHTATPWRLPACRSGTTWPTLRVKRGLGHQSPRVVRARHVHRLFDSIRRFLKQFESSREEHVDQNRHTVKSSWELTIRAEEDELDGGWIAMCEQMPGTWSQGETEDEAIENLLEAVAGVLQVMALDAGHRLITVEGDSNRVTRTAHVYPAEVRVYAGSPHTRPKQEMGGPSMCPSVLLEVLPDGSYALWEINGVERTLKAEGQLKEHS